MFPLHPISPPAIHHLPLYLRLTRFLTILLLLTPLLSPPPHHPFSLPSPFHSHGILSWREVTTPFLWELFNRSLSTAKVLEAIRSAYITAMLKKSDLDTADVRSYRQMFHSIGSVIARAQHIYGRGPQIWCATPRKADNTCCQKLPSESSPTTLRYRQWSATLESTSTGMFQ